MYNNLRATVQTEVREADYFAATTDLWSSRTTEPHMSLTVHFIATDFTMKSKCLQTVFFPDDHTENAMKDSRIDRVTGLCKKIVGAFSHSWKRRRDLTTAQKELKLPEHQLKTECPTRWGSRQAMIQRILEQLPAITRVFSSDRKVRHLVPGYQDIEVLETLNSTLSPLADFTDALSGELYVSVSSVKPVLHLFKTSVLAVKDDDTELTKKVKSNILKYLQDKYSDPSTQDLLDMATNLDPRFKMTYISEEKKATVRARLAEEMTSITVAMCMPTPSPGLSTKKARKTLGSFFKEAQGNEESLSQEPAVASELEAYLLTGNIDSEEDPLIWWQQHQSQYPRLSVLGKKYLCIPATSSPSERLFSTGGNIVTCHRTSLKPEHVDRLVFLARNL
ncbi:hypothetical protein GJAV_G00130530 [Gymnothorax javanicus]|nr:hypothetical protein GJAV_G00130530 [Gymnothorax javanicus]